MASPAMNSTDDERSQCFSVGIPAESGPVRELFGDRTNDSRPGWLHNFLIAESTALAPAAGSDWNLIQTTRCSTDWVLFGGINTTR